MLAVKQMCGCDHFSGNVLSPVQGQTIIRINDNLSVGPYGVKNGKFLIKMKTTCLMKMNLEMISHNVVHLLRTRFVLENNGFA